MTALTGRAQSPGLHPLSGLPILSDDGDDPEQFARATANYDIADRYTLAHPAASSTNARLVGSPEVNKELLPPLSEDVALSGLYEGGSLFSEDETLGRSGYPSIDPTYEMTTQFSTQVMGVDPPSSGITTLSICPPPSPKSQISALTGAETCTSTLNSNFGTCTTRSFPDFPSSASFITSQYHSISRGQATQLPAESEEQGWSNPAAESMNLTSTYSPVSQATPHSQRPHPPRNGLRASGANLARILGGRSRSRKAGLNVVVLIFIKYTGWYRKSTDTSEAVSMQLDSVENDLVEVLKYLHYRHSDTQKPIWHLLVDFGLDYTDETGETKALKRTKPTREAILHALEEAGKTGRSVLVYFCGHGAYGRPGASVLSKSEGRTRFTVYVHEPLGSKSSFLIAIDGGRIYGEDIISRLPEKLSSQIVHTVMLDACSSSGLTRADGAFYRYHGEPSEQQESSETSEQIASAEQSSSKQLVIISVCHEGEQRKAIHQESGRVFGTLTNMLHWLKRQRR